jgi:hypothetical protein
MMKMCERVFIIQCLKRSNLLEDHTIYWGPNYQGYVETVKAAGKYAAEALGGAAGVWGDWIAHPHWIECEERAAGGWC